MHVTFFTTLACLSLTAMACDKVTKVTHTFYGWRDNSPPGPNIAYDCGRGYKAGGKGTWDDPLTFASAPGEFKKCERIYDPYTQKYLRFEDTCAKCTSDWNGSPKINHIDVWTGSNKEGGGKEQIQCENDLTPADRSQTIITNPAKDLPVDTTVLYVKGDKPACKNGHVYPKYNPNDYCKN